MSLNLTKNQMIKWIITIAITLILFLIPETGFYVGPVKKFFVITVFSLAVIAFEFFPAIVMALLMPMLWVWFGVCPATTATATWSGSTMPMLIGMFVMIAMLVDCGLLNRIAYWMMSKLAGNFLSLLFGVFFVGVILALITSGSGHVILGALCAGLCISLGIMKTKAGAAISFAAMVGACTSHSYIFMAPATAVIRSQAPELLSEPITPISMFLHNWPMMIVSMIMIFIVSKWYKPETPFESKDYFRTKYKELGKITYQEKCNTVMLIAVMLFVCTGSIHGIDVNLGYAIFPFLVFFIGGSDPKCLKKVDFGMAFFIGSCMAIGSVATSLGLGTVLSDICLNILAGRDNIFLIMAVLFAVIFVLNFVMTPMAIWSVFTAPVMGIVSSLGMEALPFVYALITCSEAIILPYEYPPYLIIYGLGMMSMGDFIKLNIMRCIIFLIGFFALLIPYWSLIGLT